MYTQIHTVHMKLEPPSMDIVKQTLTHSSRTAPSIATALAIGGLGRAAATSGRGGLGGSS